ncbi:MAG: GEVED domain-containing protein [Chitinophagales bacterium]
MHLSLHTLLKRTLGTAAVVALCAASANAQYCTPTYTTGTVEGDYCSNVVLGTIMNATGGAPSPFYTTYLGMSTDLQQGSSYTVSVTSGSYTSNNDFGVWIDYNADGDFGDAGELVGTVQDLGAFSTGNITFSVPGTATLGVTRMRVREIWNMPATPDPCANYGYGEAEDYGINVTEGGGGGGGTTAWYIYSNVYGGGEPWFSTNNTTDMNGVFGPEGTGWFRGYFETVNVATVFSDATCFVYLEGGDAMADELEAFLTANMATIEAWVSGGGHLLLNAAPNEGDGMSFGFGGTSLVYSYFTSTSNAVDAGHPIFNGPFLPCGTTFTGTSFGHARITGTGLTNLMNDAASPTNIVVAEKAWGSGMVMFGGMTTVNWHSPSPNADNLRKNMFSYLGSCAAVDVCETATGLYVDGITGTTATLHWDDMGAYGYQLTIRNDDTNALLARPHALTNSYLVTGLTPGTNYGFRVRTVCTPYVDVAVNSGPSYFSTPGRFGEIEGISLYPNPNNGNFTLQLNGLENSDITVEVFNSVGSLVYANNISVSENDYAAVISLENAAAGMYQVRITNGTSISNYPVMIQK